MNGKDINDQRVRVEIAGQPKKPKGPQPNDECRLCGRKGHWYMCDNAGKTTVLTSEGRSTCEPTQETQAQEQVVIFFILLLFLFERQKEKVRKGVIQEGEETQGKVQKAPLFFLLIQQLVFLQLIQKRTQKLRQLIISINPWLSHDLTSLTPTHPFTG